MPRLLVYNRSYDPDLGATGQLLTELCEDLVRHHGWDVTVVAGVPTAAAGGQEMPRRAIVSRESVHGVTVLRAAGTRLSNRRFPGRAANYLSYLGSAAVASFRARRPDVVVALTDPAPLGVIAQTWARRWGVPFVFVCQDIFPEVARLLEDFRSPALERQLERLSRRLIRKASRTVAIGETMKERLVRLRGADPSRITVIHNWGDLHAMRGAARDNAFTRANGLLDRFVVMHAGNIGLGQGLESVLEAGGLLASDCPELELVFVGDGSKRASLEAMARARKLQNVRFLPYLPRERMQESYAATDLFVISLKPGLGGFIVPSKLYSILAAGKPYVAAVDADSEVATITRRFCAGVVIPPGDTERLAEGIRHLYRDRARLASFGEGARAAAPFFDRPVAVGAYDRLLRDVCAVGWEQKF